ncbi:nucleic acid-binding, OB-fold protein, partial [Tanacetum coccineum]
MITTIRENKEWHYISCSQCTKKVSEQDGEYDCEDHGQQNPLTYRYNFKGTSTDGTANVEFTFFTPVGDKVTSHPCSELAEKYKHQNRRQLHIEIRDIIGKKHVFQIHFTASTQKGTGEFTVDDILDKYPAIEGPSSVAKIIA